MPRPKSRQKKRRLNVELPVATLKRIDEIQKRLGTDSATEAVRRAIDIAAMVVRESSRGGKVIVERLGGTKERIHVL